MAKVWVHNGHLQVEGEKMAKSLGNFVTIRELFTTDKFGGKKWPGEVLRLAILRTHYRQPIDFTVKALEEAYQTCAEWFVAIATAARLLTTLSMDDNAQVPDSVLQALQDDLNTPVVIAVLHELHAKARANDLGAASQLKASLEVLGIHVQHEDFLKWYFLASPWPDDQRDDIASTDLPLDDEVARLAYMDDIERRRKDYMQDYLRERALNDCELDTLISARDSARKNKNWAEADRIRDELAAMGIVLKDNKDAPTTWEPKR